MQPLAELRHLLLDVLVLAALLLQLLLHLVQRLHHVLLLLRLGVTFALLLLKLLLQLVVLCTTATLALVCSFGFIDDSFHSEGPVCKMSTEAWQAARHTEDGDESLLIYINSST